MGVSWNVVRFLIHSVLFTASYEVLARTVYKKIKQNFQLTLIRFHWTYSFYGNIIFLFRSHFDLWRGKKQYIQCSMLYQKIRYRFALNESNFHMCQFMSRQSAEKPFGKLDPNASIMDLERRMLIFMANGEYVMENMKSDERYAYLVCAR